MTEILSDPAYLYSPVAKLPLFDTSEVVWEFHKLPETEDRDYFVRPVRLLPRIGASFPLNEILERTDQEFQKLSHYTGALILPHMWGMVKRPHNEGVLEHNEFTTHSHADLPEDVLLAARVEVIHDILPVSPLEYSKLKTGIRRYVLECDRQGYRSGTNLVDIESPRQYTKGRARSIPEPTLMLHDIEPLIVL